MATVRKRTWTYKGQEKTAWIADYFDQGGRRRQRTFATKGAASEWLDETKAEVRKGTHTADSASITVGQAGDLWLERCERDGLERSTIDQRRQHVNLHIKPFLGKRKLSRLTGPMVGNFVERLRDEGRSEAMVRKVLTSLKILIGVAQAKGKVAQNVARGVKLRRLARQDDGVTVPTKAELRTMMSESTGRLRPLIVMAIFTGMRASEIRGLTWEHVDFDAKVIRVRQRADAWGKMGPPKSKAGRRDIPMAPTVANTLKEWQLVCPKGELGLVFPNGAGNVESYSNIYKRGYRPLLERCGIGDGNGKPKYTFHALRHAAASLFIAQGWQPKKVQTVIGHASIAMTYDLYGHLWPDLEDDQAAMAQIEARLIG